MFDMRRREFVMALGSVAAGWPLKVRAQQPAMPVIGLLRSTPSAPFVHLVTSFRQGLNEVGFVEGQNVAIDTAMRTISLIGFSRSRATWFAAK